jgi:hypothetical protein
VTLFFFIRNSTPFAFFVTILSLRFCVLERKLYFADLYAEVRQMLRRLLVEMRRLQKLLRRDAPAKPARSAKRLSFSTSATRKPNYEPRIAAT